MSSLVAYVVFVMNLVMVAECLLSGVTHGYGVVGSNTTGGMAGLCTLSLVRSPGPSVVLCALSIAMVLY